MKKLKIIIAFLFIQTFIFSQDYKWAKTLGSASYEYGKDIVVDSSGNTYTIGLYYIAMDFDPGNGTYLSTFNGGSDFYVLKLDANGNFVWVKTIGGNGNEDVSSIALDSQENIVISGSFSDTVDFDPGPSQFNLISNNENFILKLDGNGNFIWAKNIGYAFVNDMNIDENNDIYITGSYGDTLFCGNDSLIALGSSPAFVIKLSESGDYVWAKEFDNAACNSICIGSQGEVVLGGYFNNSMDADPSDLIFTLNSNGGSEDAFIIKLDSIGNLVFGKSFGGSSQARINSVALDNNSQSILITGSFLETVDFDPSSSIFNLISLPLNSDVFVLKLDNSGEFVWAKSFGGNDLDYSNSICIDNYGNLWILGIFSQFSGIIMVGGSVSVGPCDFDPSTNNFNLFPTGGEAGDVFISKLDSLGNFIWAGGFGGNMLDHAGGIRKDRLNNIYATGAFLGASDFNPGTAIETLTSSGGSDIFVLKLNPFCIISIDSVSKSNVSCFGNNNGIASINASQGNGNIAYNWAPGNPNGDGTNSVSQLTANNYTVTVTDQNGCATNATISITEPPQIELFFTASPQMGTAPLAVGFNNTTPNRTSYTYFWSFGDGTASTSNAPTVFHGYSTPGFYDVSVIATSITTGCKDTLLIEDYVLVTGPGGCMPSATITPSGNLTVCEGSTITLNSNTSNDFNYQWYFNNIPINGATTNTYLANQSGYYSVGIIQDGCPSSSEVISAYTQLSFVSPPQPTITSSGTIAPCVGGNVTLTASTSVSGAVLQWNTNESGNSITVETAGTYWVSVYDPSSGCSTTSDHYTVSGALLAAPSICMVTVDDQSSNNIIYWNKSSYSSKDTFIVYRDIANNNFMPIGKVPFDSISMFVDTVRSLYSSNGDPNVSSWRYKLSVKDSCGSESALSPFHQTMFIQNNSSNFSWNHYQIEGQPLPVPVLQNYEFTRDNLSDGNWISIQSLSASSTAYTDPNYGTFQPTANWRVETQWSISCDPTLRINGNNEIQTQVVRSKSNIKNNRLVGLKDNFEVSKISVYPNPATNNIIVESKTVTDKFSLILLNALGEKIYTAQEQSNKTEIYVESLSRGVYTLQLKTNKEIILYKVVLQ